MALITIYIMYNALESGDIAAVYRQHLLLILLVVICSSGFDR